MEILAVPGKELTYSFANVAYKDYAVAVLHDENMDHTWATDPKTQMPLEGITFVNGEKVNFSSMEGTTFDNLKFSLNQPEKTVEAKMVYPSFR